MNTNEIMNKVNRTVQRAGLQLKKHSPEILVVSGIAGFVATSVLAVKATPKANAILKEAKRQVDVIHQIAERPEEFVTEDAPEPATQKDINQALTITYAKTGLELAKTYAPAIAVGTLSAVAILAGHNILKKRYVATAAAYIALDSNFKEYRGRVIERFGEALDKELRYNIKTKEVEEVVVNEDGSESVVKTTVEEIDPNTVGDYARFFDELCTGYTKGQPELNLMFLKRVEDYMNDKLEANGHLFLNEVFDALGMPRTPVGQVVGWIYDLKDSTRDSYVSFGNIFDVKNPDKRDFVNGREPAILLEFNCDGPIFELIGHK